MRTSYGMTSLQALIRKKYDLLVVALALGVLLVAATYNLSNSPAIWYDEGFYTQAAMNLGATGSQGLQIAPGVYESTGYVTVGYPLLYPVSVAYDTFGVSVLSGRSVMVVFILLFAGAAYVLMCRLFSGRTAAHTLLLLSTFPMLYGNGKSVLGEVPGLFFLVLTLLAFLWLERSSYRGFMQYACVGLAAGFCAATKPIFAILAVALFIAWLVRHKTSPLELSGVVSGIAGFLFPLTIWFSFQFSGQESAAAIFAAYANPYEANDMIALAITNSIRFFTESTPLFTLLLTTVWGASFLLRRGKRIVSTTELGAFIFAILIMLHYLRMEGWYRYLFPATIVALLFLPSALTALYEWASTHSHHLRRMRWAPTALVLILASLQLYQTTFASYVANYYASTRTEKVTAVLTALGPDVSLFLYDAPELAILMPSTKYYQYIHPHPGLEIGKDQLEVLRIGTADYVIAGAVSVAEAPESFSAYVPFIEVGPYVVLQRN